MNEIRRQIVLKHARKLGCDSVAAFNPENIFYLTNFWGEGIALCDEDQKITLFVPLLETERAINSTKDCDIVSVERGSKMTSRFLSAIRNRKTCTDCFDHSVFKAYKGKFDNHHKLIANNEPFIEARMIKDEKEILSISKTAAILDRLFMTCTEKIKEGISERELQATLIYQAMKMGASPPSYRWTLDPLIIASGPNGAQPHAQISDRKLRSGDLIVVDLTLRHEGYIADATRTFGLGTIPSDMVKVYNVVRESQESGLKALSEGVACGEIDHVCRQVIKQSNFEEFFVHSTGHGFGLDIHEPPWLRASNRQKLKRNMSVTVEPGIYLQERFGVRIEDSIIIGSVVKNLCQFTKELIVKG